METVGSFGWSSTRVREAYRKALSSGLDVIKFQAMSGDGKTLLDVVGEITRNKRNNVFTITWPDGHKTHWYD